MTTKLFVLKFAVKDEVARDAPSVIEARKAQLEGMSLVTGPRGGIYVLEGPCTSWSMGQSYDDYLMGYTTYATTRMARYIRPYQLRRRANLPSDKVNIPQERTAHGGA